MDILFSQSLLIIYSFEFDGSVKRLQLFEAAPCNARFAPTMLSFLGGTFPLQFLSADGILYHRFLEVVYQLVVVLFENLTPSF